MKRYLWLLMFLPATLAAVVAWEAIRPGKQHFVSRYHIRVSPEQLAAEPLLQTLAEAEGRAVDVKWGMGGRRLASYRELPFADLQWFLAELEDAGVTCDPSAEFRFERSPAPFTHQISVESPLESQHALAFWLSTHLDPGDYEIPFSSQYSSWSIPPGYRQGFHINQGRHWTLDRQRPLSQVTCSFVLPAGWFPKYHRILETRQFTLANSSLVIRGPLWPLAFLALSLPVLLVRFWRPAMCYLARHRQVAPRS